MPRHPLQGITLGHLHCSMSFCTVAIRLVLAAPARAFVSSEPDSTASAFAGLRTGLALRVLRLFVLFVGNVSQRGSRDNGADAHDDGNGTVHDGSVSPIRTPVRYSLGAMDFKELSTAITSLTVARAATLDRGERHALWLRLKPLLGDYDARVPTVQRLR